MFKATVTLVGRFGVSVEVLTKRVKEMPLKFNAQEGRLDVVVPGLLAVVAWWKK